MTPLRTNNGNPNKDFTATVLFDEKDNLPELLQPIKR